MLHGQINIQNMQRIMLCCPPADWKPFFPYRYARKPTTPRFSYVKFFFYLVWHDTQNACWQVVPKQAKFTRSAERQFSCHIHNTTFTIVYRTPDSTSSPQHQTCHGLQTTFFYIRGAPDVPQCLDLRIFSCVPNVTQYIEHLLPSYL